MKSRIGIAEITCVSSFEPSNASEQKLKMTSRKNLGPKELLIN